MSKQHLSASTASRIATALLEMLGGANAHRLTLSKQNRDRPEGHLFKHRSRLRRTVSLLTSLILFCLVAVPPGHATRFGQQPYTPTYWCSDAPYVDVFMTAYGWNAKQKNAQGYPTSGLGQCGFGFVGYPPGDYIFWGEGTFDISFAGSEYSQYPYLGFVPGTKKKIQVNGVNVITGVVRITTNPVHIGGGDPYVEKRVLANLYSINDPTDPPRNFQLICPGYPAPPDPHPLFRKEYVQALAPFSCLRFVDWMWQDTSPTQPGNDDFGVWNWDSRPKPDVWGFTKRGICYENMIELCNETNSDMWINVPIFATDDWCQGIAALCKERLNPNLHVYYEINDELWNWGGPAFWPHWNLVETWAKANPDLQGLGVNGWELHGAEMGYLLMHAANNMQGILGSQGRPILAGQLGNPPYCTGGLKYINSAYGPPAQFIWGIATATYIGSSSADAPPTDLASVFTSMNDYFNSVTIPNVKADVALAKKYGINYCCYESGQGLYGSNPAQNLVMQQAQTDPQMRDVYIRLANFLVSQGADVVNFYSFCRPDAQNQYWGTLHDIRELPSPTVKYQAQIDICASYNGKGSGSGGGGGPTDGGGNPPGSRHGFIPPHKQFGFGNKNRSGFYKTRHAMPIKQKGFVKSPGMSRKSPD